MTTRSIAWISWLCFVLLTACGPEGRPASAPNSGLVAFSQAQVAGAASHSLIGAFVEFPLADAVAGELPGCDLLAESGGCRALDCSGASMFSGADAGTLSASVEGTELVTATLGESGTYSASGSGLGFSAGDTVVLAGTGGEDVAAFEATLTAPEAPDLTIPATISPSEALSITWSASLAAEEMQISILPGTPGNLVTCRVPVAGGGVTIDPSLVGELAPGGVTITASAYNSAQVDGGPDYDVFVSVNEGAFATATVE